MVYAELGSTGIMVSRIAMGCMTIVDTVFSGDHDEATGVRTLQAALDAGINFFDTAEMYGDGASEVLLGKAFKGRWDKIVIASIICTRGSMFAERRRGQSSHIRAPKPGGAIPSHTAQPQKSCAST